MICYFCQGQRFIHTHDGPQPCAECGGTGELNCCEGLQAQPEPDQVVRVEGPPPPQPSDVQAPGT